MEDRLYKIFKFNIKDLITNNNKEANQNYRIEINQDTINDVKSKYKTLIRENEIIRIIKCLDLDNNCTEENGYCFINDIIAMDISTTIYKKIKANDGIVHINIVTKDKEEKNITLKTTKFKRLLASSSNVRNKKVIFIRKDLWSKANDILLCGLSANMSHPTFAKFNAYYALPSTDSIPVTMPNVVVIDDYKKDITEFFDVVREGIKVETSDNGQQRKTKTYKVENNSKCTETILPFDGGGLVDISLSTIWKNDLGLDYIPSAFQFRCIAGLKGNVYTFDIFKFAKEHGKAFIIDAWGIKRNLFNKEGTLAINVILTKSQYKFFKQYTEEFGKEKAFDKWLENFNTETHGYKRTFNISKFSDNPKELKNKTLLSYQPLQSLDLKEEQIKILCRDTINTIKDISTNVDSFLKFRGLMQEDEGKSQIYVPEFYKALQQNKELFYDEFMQKKIQNDIKGFKERSYLGGLIAPGNYQTLICDVLALAEFAFGMDVVGGLKAKEVYSKYWMDKGVNEIDIIRFPHIANEHSIARVINPYRIIYKIKDVKQLKDITIVKKSNYRLSKSIKKNSYYKYITEGIVTSIYDSIALKANSADYDGDHILTNNSRVLIQAVKTAIKDKKTNKLKESNTILPKLLETKSSKKVYKIKDIEQFNGIIASLNNNIRLVKLANKRSINNMKELIETDCRGMGNDIGSVVNKISKLWSLVGTATGEELEKIHDYIKIMSVIGSLTIDFVKTGEKSPVPKEIEDYLKDVKKPLFMKIKYKREGKKQKKINKNEEILGLEEKTELFSEVDCTMNRIFNYMQEQVENIKLQKEDGEYSFTKIIKEKVNRYSSTYKKLKELLIELKEEYDEIASKNIREDDYEYNQDKKQEHEYKYKMFYSYCKLMFLGLCNKQHHVDENKVIDCLIYAFFCDKDFAVNNVDQSILWNTFGEKINQRFDKLNKMLNGEVLEDEEIYSKQMETLAKQVKEKREKIKEAKNKSKEVHIKLFDPKINDKGKKESAKEIELYNSEIQYFNKKIEDSKLRKIAFVLYVVSKFYKAYKDENAKEGFEIVQGEKEKINKSQILKLADIHSRDWSNLLQVLRQEKFFAIDFKDKEKHRDTLICISNIKVDKLSGYKYAFTDINKCRDFLKKLA